MCDCVVVCMRLNECLVVSECVNVFCVCVCVCLCVYLCVCMCLCVCECVWEKCVCVSLCPHLLLYEGLPETEINPGKYNHLFYPGVFLSF